MDDHQLKTIFGGSGSGGGSMCSADCEDSENNMIPISIMCEYGCGFEDNVGVYCVDDWGNEVTRMKCSDVVKKV